MNTVEFTIEGEVITKVVNNTDMSDEFVNHLIRTFIDLGWIITEKKTVGSFSMTTDDTVHIEFELTEFDGNVDPYELDESSFSHLLTDDEPIQPTQKIGFMSNLSQA